FLSTPPPTAQIYTLSLHDALPISRRGAEADRDRAGAGELENLINRGAVRSRERGHTIKNRYVILEWDDSVGISKGHETPSTSRQDRKSTRLNSSHRTISYAVFCLK